MTQKPHDKISASEKRAKDWLNNKWRPMMGWSYMLTCITDFVLFPILWSILQVMSKGQVTIQWNPITLQGAGLYHIAMGAILGITAYGRTQEKIKGTEHDLSPYGNTAYYPSSPRRQHPSGYFGSPTTGSYEYSGDREDYRREPQVPVVISKSGRPGPVQPDFPEI